MAHTQRNAHANVVVNQPRMVKGVYNNSYRSFADFWPVEFSGRRTEVRQSCDQRQRQLIGGHNIK
jgi:hypothetical protein